MSAGTMRGKKIQGRKRHLLVDTQGLLMSVKVLAADIGDRDGGKVLLIALVGHLPRLQVIWADSGYAGPFEDWVKEHLDGVRLEIVKHPWTGLRGVWAKEGAVIDWDTIMPKGCAYPARGVGSSNAPTPGLRTIADSPATREGTYTSSEAFIYLAMSKLMVARLARDHP
jgi:hypothetical protein